MFSTCRADTRGAEAERETVETTARVLDETGEPHRGAGRNRTVGWRFCRPLPYHLATAPESGKADHPVCVRQEPCYYCRFFSFTTIATCPSVGPYRLAVSFWLRKRISWMFSAAIDFR